MEAFMQDEIENTFSKISAAALLNKIEQIGAIASKNQIKDLDVMGATLCHIEEICEEITSQRTAK